MILRPLKALGRAAGTVLDADDRVLLSQLVVGFAILAISLAAILGAAVQTFRYVSGF